MMTRQLIVVPLILLASSICFAQPAAQTKAPSVHSIYWAGNLGVFRAATDGVDKDIQRLYVGAGCRNLALDANTHRFYISRDRAGFGVWQGNFPNLGHVVQTPFTGGDCRGIAVGNNRLFVSEIGIAIYEYDLTSLRRRIVRDKVRSPLYLAHDPFDNLLFWSDPDAHRIYKMDLKSNTVTEIATFGEPFGIAIATLPRKDDKVLFVADHATGKVVRMDYNGDNQTEIFTTVAKKWKKPQGIAVDREGVQMFVTDESTRSIWKAYLETTDKVEAIITNINGQDMNDVWCDH